MLFYSEMCMQYPLFVENEILKSIIYTDSMSVLQSLDSPSLGHPLIQEVKNMYLHLRLKNFRVVFYWVPSHMGIARNHMADVAPKSATIFLPQLLYYVDIRSAIAHLIQATFLFLCVAVQCDDEPLSCSSNPLRGTSSSGVTGITTPRYPSV
ncbi:hypothetical protein AVEN_246252-1 [Araneus ventricosus]|uniref:Uncharacterized protein n=1 Tax=Araneus ventricosus TaxID=182803 RepID=A0A4Y2LAQ9_ARAVE|nr:hypothetical protein AVEN_246252-1 [Araneus ventricosus]